MKLKDYQPSAREAVRNAAKEGHDDEELENDQEVKRDGTDPYKDVIFGRKRPDSVVIDWANKVIYVLDFKRIVGSTTRLPGEGEISINQHDILIRSLKVKVAEDAEG